MSDESRLKPRIVLEDPFQDSADHQAHRIEGQDIPVSYGSQEHKTWSKPGWTLLQNGASQGVHLPHACGARARCGTCRVQVEEGAGNLAEEDVLEKRCKRLYGIDSPEIRLACRARILAPCTVRILMTAEEAQASWNQHKSSRWKPKGGWK